MVESSRPFSWKRPNPPFGAVLLHTVVLCAYCPRRVVDRDGQHHDTLTLYSDSVVPWSVMSDLSRGITEISPASRSSESRKTKMGRAAGPCAAGWRKGIRRGGGLRASEAEQAAAASRPARTAASRRVTYEPVAFPPPTARTAAALAAPTSSIVGARTSSQSDLRSAVSPITVTPLSSSSV